MKKNILLCGLLICIPYLVIATEPSKKDTITPDQYSNFDKNLDNLINNWYVQESIGVDSLEDMVENDTTYIPSNVPDSVYINRIRKIPSLIELTYNNIVKSYINVYTVKKRDKLEVMLGLRDYYFPMFEEIFDKYGLPLELKYLSVIESALNPRATSRVGAAGLWQFMYGTGRVYKLNINSFVDERRDPILATDAAARYLRDMYKIYNDWGLVIAAYNCGPGNVNKAIRRSGGKTNYWDIYYYLPRETRGYFPAYVAATYAMNYYKEHNLSPKYIDVPPFSDTIMVNKNIHLEQIADVLKLPIQQLRDLNPQYRRDIVPGEYNPSPLRLPAQFATKYIENEDSIVSYHRDQLFSGDFKTITPANFKNMPYSHVAPSGNMQKNYYTVKSGDNLGSISDMYHVSLSDLRYWNNINRNMIRPGQKLIVYVPKTKVHVAQNSKVNASSKTASSDEYIYYEVKNGDTLWNIASQYTGVTAQDLRSWNNLGANATIKAGEKLKIRKL
jgi:membrane-bound lytic murein transglycosylase D